jgi:hypothetical protein
VSLVTLSCLLESLLLVVGISRSKVAMVRQMQVIFDSKVGVALR